MSDQEIQYLMEQGYSKQEIAEMIEAREMADDGIFDYYE